MKDAPKAAVGSRLKRPALIAAGLLVGVGFCTGCACSIADKGRLSNNLVPRLDGIGLVWDAPLSLCIYRGTCSIRA